MKKLLTFILLCLGLFSLSYGALTDRLGFYYTYNNTLTELTGTGYTLTSTNSADSSSNCKLGTCREFGGSAYNTRANEIPNLNSTGFSLNMWTYEDTTQASRVLFSTSFGGSNYIELRMLNGDPNILLSTSGSVYSIGTGTNYNTQLIMITTSWKNNNLSIYINGVYKNSVATTGTISSANIDNRYDIGGRGTTGTLYYDGRIDEVGYWSRGLSSSEITELYNVYQNGKGYPFLVPATISSIKTQKGTLTNNSYFNTTTLNFNVTTDKTTNKKYTLLYHSNGTIISSGLMTGSSFSSYTNLTLFPNKFKIYFNATNINGSVTSSNYTFTIDTTAPVITNKMPSSQLYNYTLLKLTNYISCSDTNLVWCNISTDTFNKNATATNNITYTTNGNKTYTLIATDRAGNRVTTSGAFRVNPYQYFRFQNGTKKLGGYTFGGKSPYSSLNYTRFATYNDGLSLGSNTLSFIKTGFVTQAFTFNVTTSSKLNLTYNVSPAKIRLTFKDKRTGAILSGRNIAIQLIGNVGLNTSTTTGYKNISNTFIANGFYQILATSNGYTSESVFFDYTNQQNLDRTIYMINSSYINLGYVTIFGKDSVGIPVSGCYARALQWDAGSSAFITTSEVITSTDGKGNVYVILDEKSYKFSLTCSNVTVYAPQEVIETVENGKIIPLTMGTTENQLEYSPYSVTGDVFLLSTLNDTMRTSTIQFNFNNILGTDVTGCAVVYKTIGSIQVEQLRVCNTTVNGVVFIPNYYFNISYNYKVAGEVNQGQGYFEVDQLIVSSATSFQNIFSMFLIIIPVLIMGLAFALGLSMDPPANLITSQILGIAGAISLYFLVPSIIDLTSSFVIMAIICLTLWGVVKK